MRRPAGMRSIRTPRSTKSIRDLKNEGQTGYLKLHILNTLKKRFLQEKKRHQKRLSQVEDKLEQINEEIRALQKEMGDQPGGFPAASRDDQEDEAPLFEY